MVAAGTYNYGSEPSVTLNDDIRVIGADSDTTTATRSRLIEKPPFFKLTHKDAFVANMKLMDANNGGAQVSGVDVVAGTVSRATFTANSICCNRGSTNSTCADARPPGWS